MTTKLSRILVLAIVVIGVGAAGNAQADSRHRKKIIDEAFHELDSNGDKRISEREYTSNKSGEAKEGARKRFRSLDTDRDRTLTHKEFMGWK
jgi:hypothetical protein